LTATLTETPKKPRKAARTVVEPPVVALPAPPTVPVRVVGVDLSLTATGLAWPDRTMVHGRDGLTTLPISTRGQALCTLADELVRQVGIGPGAQHMADPAPWAPTLVVIENLPTGRTAGGTVSTEKGYVWWEFVRQCTLPGLSSASLIEVTPSVIKKYATGNGNANKREMIAAVRELFPWLEIRKTGKRGMPLGTYDDNKADAVVLCAIGCELLGHPLVSVPPANRKALAKLQLPEGTNR
jgi:crossover junction endodeoxyribonuclease RuvC